MVATILQDVSTTGKVRPWEEHKMANHQLATAYDDIDPAKADRLRGCANEVHFLRSPEGKMTLSGTWFCRVRLCPMCTWRRSLKVAAHMTKIMAEIQRDQKYKYILLTLTVRNCDAEDLDGTITNMLRAFSNLTKLVAFQSVAKGWYRSLEITHDVSPIITREMVANRPEYYAKHGLWVGSINPNYDTYHPHIHAVIAVPAGYFSGGRYIKQDRWAAMWQQCLKVDYAPRVDVRKVKGETASAVAEVAKYAVKASDYIIPDDWDLTVDTVRLLDKALHNRRFVAYGGIFRVIHKRLNLDKPEEGDLVHVDGESAPEQGTLLTFVWHSGYRQYHQGTL